MLIEMDTTSLEETLKLVKDLKLKEKLKDYLEEFTADIKQLNEMLTANKINLFSKKKLRLIEYLKEESNKIEGSKYKEDDKDCAEEFFGQIYSAVMRCSPPLKLETLEAKQEHQKQEKTLFEEQTKLNSSSQFRAALENVAQQKTKRLVKMYLIYAWPEPEYKEREALVQKPFLETLYTHLELAGIKPIRDLEDNFSGSNLKQFMAKLLNAHYVLILGTESFRKKWLSNKHALSFEKKLLELKWLNDFDKGFTTDSKAPIMPYVLTAIRETAFPDELFSKQDITIRSWRKSGYQTTLIDILVRVYGLEKERIIIEEKFKDVHIDIQEPVFQINSNNNNNPSVSITNSKIEVETFTLNDPTLIKIKKKLYSIYQDKQFSGIQRIFETGNFIPIEQHYVNLALIKEEEQKEHEQKKKQIHSKKEIEETLNQQTGNKKPASKNEIQEPGLSSYESLWMPKEPI